MSRGTYLALGLAVGIAVVSATSVRATAGPEGSVAVQDTFPHLDHQGLFPLCTGCHLGVPDGVAATTYPEPASCDGCHDGVEVRRVEWSPPVKEPGLLDFSHVDHGAEVAEEGEPEVDCAGCHVSEGGSRMAVVPIEAPRCFSCHGDEAEDHYSEDRSCAECHRPVADAPGARGRVEAFPEPAGHDEEVFLSSHAPQADDGLNRCATCHVQQRCTSCHVDTGLQEIQRLKPAPGDWHLPLMEARYPTPQTHTSPYFERTHGDPEPASGECSTCHTRDDCAACHLEPLPASAQALPPRPVEAGSVRHDTLPVVTARGPGVWLESRLPGSHDSPFFLAAHSTVAAAAPESCAGCHTESYCADCHDAPTAPGFHPANFATRHAAAASSMSSECSNCHNTQAFCRQCHLEMGFGSQGRLGPGYHDAEPLWLLRHGQGARQGLEQCVSCHTQRDCLQCHSQLGAFKVNPHGPDFDPEQARARNPWICSACHIGTPGG